MKTYKQNKALVAIVFLLAGFLSVSIIGTKTVSAAEPGCYAKSSTGTALSVAPYNCPSEQYARGIAAPSSKCYVFTAGSSKVSPTGVETDCASFQVGSNPVGSATPTSPSVDPGFKETSSVIGGDSESGKKCDPGEGVALNRDNCGIINLLVIAINFLSAVAGIAIIASMMIAGFQYMTAQDNANQVQQARKRIIMALTGLALFIFMYALLNFLVPGGVF